MRPGPAPVAHWLSQHSAAAGATAGRLTPQASALSPWRPEARAGASAGRLLLRQPPAPAVAGTPARLSRAPASSFLCVPPPRGLFFSEDAMWGWGPHRCVGASSQPGTPAANGPISK